jgi:uncharacterized protein
MLIGAWLRTDGDQPNAGERQPHSNILDQSAISSKTIKGNMLTTLYRAIILAVLLAAGRQASAATFSCNTAKSPAEKQVCADPSLSQLDNSLNEAYKKALTSIVPSSRRELIHEQRDWIHHVRDVCNNEKCLIDVYQARIAMLKKNVKYLVNEAVCSIPDGKTCRSVVWYRNPAAHLDSFNASLEKHHIPGKIIGCSRLVDLPVGSADGNHSFGGICTIQDGAARRTLSICNDVMVGHFAMQLASEVIPNDQQLVRFTNEKCFGG